MRIEDLKWSKARAQCPYCEGWFTKQGILGHMRFRHPDQDKISEEYQKLGKTIYSNAYDRVMKEYQQKGSLTPETRNKVMDLMMLDFLLKKAKLYK